MKIAILSDAHGNGIYFQKCMEEISYHKPDKIIYLGDCFGYMRDGNAILTELRKLDCHILLGNHEAMLLDMLYLDEVKEEVYGLKNDRDNINEDNFEYIKSLSPKYIEEVNEKKILYVHGRPDAPLTGYLYYDDEEFDWEQSEYDYVFMGHTHRPYIKKIGTTTYVNVGSCGLPRDIGSAPSYVIFDTQTASVQLYRVKINEIEMEKISEKQVHPKVYECLMRGRKKL